ncbi:non-ribosomal peptide synthetase [Vibrio ostreicida]|uniref:non-ribosomal peptide synthetase n=1 Tax=Vibrio ostreicida TaxID=526588 RepID=UPI0009710B11|nr:non-ribosomal peptide synthetase [Vibrio ostreicida]
MSVDDITLASAHDGCGPLSHSQQRLWLFQQLMPESIAYNTGGLLHLAGEGLNKDSIYAAFNALVEQQAVLRTRLIERDGQAFQLVSEQTHKVDFVDARAHSMPEEFVRSDALARVREPYSLVDQALSRVCLYQLSDEHFILNIAVHHIITDAWSLKIFVRFIVDYLAGKPKRNLTGQSYLAFSSAQEVTDHEEAAAKWQSLNLISDEPCRLPAAQPIERSAYTARHLEQSLDLEESAQVIELAKSLGVTRFEVLSTALLLTLSVFSNHSQPCVTVPALNRNAKNRRNIGFYVNNTVVGVSITSANTLAHLVRTVHDNLVESMKFEHLPLEKLAGQLPLPSVAFNYRSHGDKLEISSREITGVFSEFPVVETPFDLVLDAVTGDQLSLRLVYACEKFTPQQIERFLTSYKQILKQICEDPEQSFSQLKTVSDADQLKLDQFCAVDQSWRRESFMMLVSNQAESRPNHVALKHAGQQLTYAELESKSNQLARYLRERIGFNEECVIGVMMERGVDMLVAMLAVLKAGAAFLPLDPDYPDERLEFMLQDSDAECLLTQQSLLAKARTLFTHHITPIESVDYNQFAEKSLQLKINLDQLAYLIYTSGSTGKPKGVAVSHLGLSMHVQTIGEQYGMTPQDTELHFASISFDGAVERWTVPLAFGSTLVIRDQHLWTPEKTTQVLLDEQVTIACLPPSYVGPWLDWVEQTNPNLSLRSLTLGGEAFTRETYERIQRVVNPPRIINGYGPTETVVTPMIWCAYPDDTLQSAYAPIGRPVGDRRLYILDSDLRRVPIGSVGELYIGMEAGLARGYLRRPDLTAERFLPDPNAQNGERMYRTGDLARFRDDGVVEYLGRADQQVKIRGFRIELGEIESRLQTLSGGELCAVVVHESPTGKRLVGYVQSSQADQESERVWRAELAEQLPDYMVPSRIIISQRLTLTPAGKVDRKQLPMPEWEAEEQASLPLCGESQRQLAQIWSELLKVDSVGADSHFFSLGGDSISALQMVGKLRHVGQMLTPKQVFDHPVLADMASCVVGSQLQKADQGLLTGSVKLLPMQSRFIEHHHHQICNQYITLAMPSPVNENALTRAISGLIKHHDALRLCFSDPVSAVYSQTAPVDLIRLNDERGLGVVQDAINVETGRLLSAGVNQETDQVVIAIHHLVVDALSWPVVIQDLLALYHSECTGTSTELPAKTHHQTNWYQALKNLTITNKVANFWQEQQAISAFPLGRNGMTKCRVMMPIERASKLFSATFKFARMDRETSLIALVALASKAVMSAEECVIHRESHGRFSESLGIDLSRSVNWHTALFPQKVQFSHDLTETIIGIKDGAHSIRDGGLSYSAGIVQKSWEYQSSVDVLFNFLGRAAQTDIIGAEIRDFGLWRSDNAKADAAIVVNISETDLGLTFDVEFAQEALTSSQSEQFLEQLQAVAEQLSNHCESQPPILSIAEAPNTKLTAQSLARISQDMAILPNKVLPLSTLQQGLYFHTQLSQDKSTYVNQITLPIKGADVSKLIEGWQFLMQRHAILRSTVHQVEGEAHLFVWDSLQLANTLVDAGEMSDFDLDAYRQSIIKQGFTIEQSHSAKVIEPLWRLDIVTTGNEDIACIFTIHHILMDGWSTGILLSELMMRYQDHGLTAVSHDFSDYLEWVAQQPQDRAEHYWREYLNGVEAPTLLAEQYGSITSQQGHIRYNVDFPTSTLAKWQSQLNASGITLNTLVQGAWLLTLQRYTGQNNPVFGNTVAGRPSTLDNSESMVGLFINTLPVTAKVNWQASVSEWLGEVQSQASAQREFSHVSLSQVQAQSPLQGENLFDSLVVFENYPLDENVFSDSGLSLGEPDSYEFTHYPLTLAVLPGESLRIVFAYDSKTFSESEIRALSVTMSHFLEQMVAKLDQKLCDMDILDSEQQQRLKEHKKEAEVWHYQAFTELLTKQAVVQPQREALVAHPLDSEGGERVSLSYQLVDQQSDAVAASLLDKGIDRDQRVAVLFSRGVDMLVTMIGVLKAGAAFLPLDPSYPQERLAYMVEDSKARWLICDPSSQSLANSLCVQEKVLSFDDMDLTRALCQQPEILPDQLAYVIYTSGSTGKPKGVCVSHLGLSMHVQTIGQCYGMTPDDIELHFASISFDGAIERWAVPLAFGSKLVIRDQQLWSARETCEVLTQEGVTIACFPPSYVGPLLEWIEHEQPKLAVRSWTLGGEAFTRDTYFKLQQVLNPQRVINGYGPTETVVTPMIWQAYVGTPLDSAYAPIGKAVGSRSLYVLDDNLYPVPSGVSGELYIGEEVGLARGYLEKPMLTAERFIPDPFASNGQRMYRTGDLVRWRDDGVMDYLGRADDQIKIRGFRIELGEIESLLQTLSGAKLSAVKAFEGPSGAYLVGYLQTGTVVIDEESILGELAKTLPDYMIPQQLIMLESLPLTPASKVDKKRLPHPVSKETQSAYEPPKGPMEELLASQWRTLFGLKRVSRTDDFFALGGQSLLATQLVGRLQHSHQVHLPLQTVFDSPRLDKMAVQCHPLKQTAMAIERVPRAEYMHVSASQKRLWFIQQLMPESSAYHMPIGLKLHGELCPEGLACSLQALVDRHEILRTSLCQVDGELMQSVQSKALLVLATSSLKDHEDIKAQRLAWIDENFDFASPPLMRAYLVKHNPEEYELLLVIHHIVSDGISVQALVDELGDNYRALIHGQSSTPDRPVANSFDYADYAHWQRNWLESEQAKQSLAWWKDRLNQDIEPLVLHSEVPRDQLATGGERHHFALEKKQVDAIQSLAKRYETTGFNVMLSLWHLLLHKYSGRDEIRVGIPVAGRTLPETLNMQGCFINNLVVAARLDASMCFSTLLNEVKRFTEQALSHQDVPFEVLVESLGVTGNLQHHPLYQTSFNFQTVDREAFANFGSLVVEPFDPGVVAAQLELSLDIQAYSDGHWSGFVNYATPVFNQAYIAELLTQWLQLLEQVADNPELRLSQLSLVSSKQLPDLHKFNATEISWGDFTPPPVAIMHQAQRTPDAIALSMGEESLTYAEFDLRVNQTAQWLRGQGVDIETRVGLGLTRSVDMVIALHAITRAGGAYVPLDPSYPSERIRYLLESADVSLVVTDSERVNLWPNHSASDYVAIDKIDLNGYSSDAPKVNWQAEQAIYVIFTSGSTGRPKGVVNTHKALQNRLAWMQHEYGIDGTDCVLQKTPFSFDVSVWEFFWPLMTGARLAIAEPEHHRQPELLHKTICEQNVTTVHFVPSMLHAFHAETDISRCSNLRRIICSGEALPAELTEQVLQQMPHCELHNLYGPTEAAIDVTSWQCQLPVRKRIPIGYAISNTQLHVLDDAWNPVPVGVPGELYLAGEGLAREYLSRPDLTAERFVPNPWGQSGARMYRTGDQVVRMSDGRLEYLGRLDHQVKIRGLRIELEEIENVLNQCEYIEESAVIAFEQPMGTQLVGYVVCELWDIDKESQVKVHLAQHLPDYMVPAVFIPLDRMPLSANGKRDRAALPAPSLAKVAYRAAQTELEVWFARCWQQALDIDTVGLDDNFFALGGHSLLATRVVASAQKELGLIVTLKDFFAAGTLQALTDTLEDQYQQTHQQEQDELDAMAALMDELELL